VKGILAEIVENTHAEVAAAKARTPFAELESMVAQAEPPRNFFAALTQHATPRHVSVIAEVKRCSPSGGLMRPEYERDAPPAYFPPLGEHADAMSGSRIAARDGFDPAWIARRYFENGASAISCLTDRRFFGGNLAYIERIKEVVPLPVLRKDFIIDPWQVWESRAHGADAILLIAECLKIAELLDLTILAQRLGLTILLEAHSPENLLRVRPHVGFPHPSYALLGINNRDLDTQRVDLNHTLRLVDMVEDTSVLVSESGIKSPDDLARLRAAGVRIVLVGESLVRDPDPGAALARLLERPVR
jgi:indole-3-glycerol phosphate synthase